MILVNKIKNLCNLNIWKYALIAVLISDVIIPFFIWRFEKIGNVNASYIENNWKLQFTEQSINSISIIFNEDYNPIISFKFDGWKSVEKVYVNNVETEIASLYMGSDFFYKKNNVFYSIVDNRRCDSIVYKFPPNDKIEIYDANKKLLKIEKNCFQSKELYNIYNSFFIK